MVEREKKCRTVRNHSNLKDQQLKYTLTHTHSGIYLLPFRSLFLVVFVLVFLSSFALFSCDFMTVFIVTGFPCGSAGKESACNAGDPSSIPGLGRSPGEGKGYPLQYSGLENSIDCIVQGVTKSWTRLSDFHFHFLLSYLDSFFLMCVSFTFTFYCHI